MQNACIKTEEKIKKRKKIQFILYYGRIFIDNSGNFRAFSLFGGVQLNKLKMRTIPHSYLRQWNTRGGLL